MCRRWAWIAAAAVLLVSCASLPIPDGTTAALVVISVRAGRTSYSGFPLAYELGLRESRQKIGVTVRDGLAMFSRLPPGTYTIDRVYTVVGPELAGGVYEGVGQPDPVGPWVFTLRQGEITILPVALEVSVEGQGPETHLQSFKPVPVDRAQVVADLARRANFGRWRVAEAGPAEPPSLRAPRPRRVDDRFRWD